MLASAITAGGSLSVLSGLPAAVFAESTLITRQQAYTRYVPRIERGRDYWATGLKKLIIAQDWKSISAAVDKKKEHRPDLRSDGAFRQLVSSEDHLETRPGRDEHGG